MCPIVFWFNLSNELQYFLGYLNIYFHREYRKSTRLYPIKKKCQMFISPKHESKLRYRLGMRAWVAVDRSVHPPSRAYKQNGHGISPVTATMLTTTKSCVGSVACKLGFISLAQSRRASMFCRTMVGVGRRVSVARCILC